MSNDAGSCGSGGPWIKPERAMQKVVWTETFLDGPRSFDGYLPQPETIAGHYRDIAVLAFPAPPDDADPKKRFRIPQIDAKNGSAVQMGKPNSVCIHVGIDAPAEFADAPAGAKIDRRKIVALTGRLGKDGRLSWDVPPGKWTVLRLGHTPTGAGNAAAPIEGRGLECDKLSREATDEHFAGLMAKLIAEVGPAAGKTLTHMHVDSWEVHSQNWTPRMRAEFQNRRGYDPLPLLPAITGRVVDDLQVSERFLWDLRKTIAEMNDECYAGRLRELAHQHGMKLSIEAYGDGTFDDLSYAGRADLPMCEFWVGGMAMQTVKEMASAAHTYGRNVVGAESFTAMTDMSRWTNHPYSLKAQGDAVFCKGVNRFVFHRYAHQPWLDRRPGMTMGRWGVQYERTQTWWEQSRPWHEYLARCNHLLRQGLFVADLCCLQTEGSPSSMTFAPASAYDFDGCSPEVVLTRMSVQDGRLVLPDGMSYRLLSLPPSETMTPSLLGKIKELVEAGATVVGPRPLKSPSLSDYPRCDEIVRRLAAELWGNCDGKTIVEHRCGKGRIVWGKTPETVLAEMGAPPDFRCEMPANTPKLHYIHRAADGLDIYFVANGNSRAVNAQCTFRVNGKRPEFWHPDTGTIERADAYDTVQDGTRIPIRFDPSGSVFVVFRPEDGQSPDRRLASRCHVGKPPERIESLDLAGPWKLRFPAGWGTPEEVVLDKLISWSRHPDSGVRYFSGTAIYRKTFHLPASMAAKDRRVYLDLGDVQVIAEVKLNGRALGILWKPPFRVDVTDAAKVGDNDLEIRVTNLWVNRLIGDEQLPEDSVRDSTGRLKEWPQWLLEGKPSPTGRLTFTTWRNWTKDSPLMESGLLGPVMVLARQPVSCQF